MPIALPPPLATFFADHAVVRDEGRTIEGPYQIKQWMKDAKAKYQHLVEPIEAPLNLEHVFTMEGEKIASLEIR